jgi:hypothetical protein
MTESVAIADLGILFYGMHKNNTSPLTSAVELADKEELIAALDNLSITLPQDV